LAKRKRQSVKRAAAAKSAALPPDPRDAPPSAEESQIQYSSLSLHELFAQQTMTMLDRSDLDEEQKQSILIAMSCPCCGAGGMSFTAKIKRRS
jgi:hypothetical protein